MPTDVVARPADLDAANQYNAPLEDIKKVTMAVRDATLEDGESTPSLKLTRNVVDANYGDDFEPRYDE